MLLSATRWQTTTTTRRELHNLNMDRLKRRPLVGGLPNEQLWTLVRRFNKVGEPVEQLVGMADLK
jgi:hypothetical protein